MNDRKTLERYRFTQTVKATALGPTEYALHRRGLLAIKPVDRNTAQVQTTDAGMEFLRGE